MLLTNQLKRRHHQRVAARRLLLERLEARNQPAVVAGAGLAVKEFFAYTGTTFPTDMSFGHGGMFGSDLFFADPNAHRIYRVGDLNNDHDASDAGESGILFQYPNSNRPVSLLFGSGASTWGDDLFVIDDTTDAATRISDDSGSLVSSQLCSFPVVNFVAPTLDGAVFSADGQFLLANNALKFTTGGGGNDGRVNKVSSSGGVTLWANGGNLPNGLWDNNSQAAMTADGWYTTGHDAIGTANGPSQIVQFRDNNGDGDALDEGEGRILVGSNVLGLNKKKFAFDSDGVLYVAGATVGGISKVFRLEDLNGDGDYFDSAANAYDAGESTVVLDTIPGNITCLRVGPDNALYVGVQESGRGVIYRVADGLPPVEPTRPDLDVASDLGLFTFDNVTRDNTPTFNGNAEAGSTVRLYSNIAGLIGTTTADASGAWTITSITLGDGVHQITATSTDAEGNVSNTSNALATTIDTIAPTISATLNKNSGATGWYNLATGAPTATFSGSDGGSGVASVSSPFTFGEGRHLQATGMVTDVAGNSATDSFFDLFVDLTPPLISATLDRQPASTGWYNLSTGAPIATIYGSDDGGSGVAFVSSPFQFGEGQHLSAPGKVVDVAGNVVIRNIFDLFVDLTPPLISATLDKQPASTGWYNLSTGAPTATIYGSDAGGSGVAFVSSPFTFGEGRNLSAPGTVIDVAGNVVNRDIFLLNVDLTPPLISATLDREPASTGWYNLSTGAPIATIYGSDDGGSGVAFVSGTYQFGEGQNLSAPGTVIDVAGNVVTRNIFSLYVDLTPPLISATLDRQPAATGWYNVSTGAPIATIYGSDAGGSGVAFVSSPFQFGEGQNLSAPGLVIDVAGNSVARDIFLLNVDLTPPTAPTITSPTNGTVTNSTVLTITGIAEAGTTVAVFGNGNLLGTTPVNSAGQWSFTTLPLVAGDHVFSAAATDVAGNTGPRASDVLVTVQNTTGPKIVPISITVGQVNLNGGGLLPVTILSSATFDARTLNAATLRLNGSRATSWSLKDVNGDGRLDLVLQFRREDFVDEYTAAIKRDLADGRLDNAHQLITLTLTGQTKDGKNILAAAQVDMFMSGKKLQELVARFLPPTRKKR